MKPTRLARTVIYENPWVNLYVDKVRFPGGRIVDPYHVLDFEMEAAGALVENPQEQLLMVRVYRYATDTTQWEIPAGTIEAGESALETVQREVWEETGYETSGHELIYTYYPMIGLGNKVFHIVRCQATAKTGDFDRSEVESFRWFPEREVLDMLQRGQLQCGFSLTALLLHFWRQDREQP